MSTNPAPLDERATAALIQWWLDSGVDCIWQDASRDRLAETAAEAERRAGRRARAGGPSPAQKTTATTTDRQPLSPQRGQTGPSGPPPAATGADRGSVPGSAAGPEPDFGFAGEPLAVPDDAVVADARERARTAESLDALREAMEAFDGCNLRRTANALVFGNGSEDADLMMIGEAPGREEDRAGFPFVGRSGQLLDRMLKSIGVDRDAVRVTNVVPWRPPGNRSPSPAETAVCLPFTQRHIELVRPRILVCLGAPSARTVLGTREGITKIRGRWTSYSYGVEPGEAIDAMAMLHPAYLLRQPGQKRLAWRDLLAVRQRLDGGDPAA